MPIDVSRRVKNLVKKHETADPYKLAKELGCVVILADLPSKVNGCWMRILRRKTIFINENLADWQQAAVLAHELGHICCHPWYTAYSTRSATFSSTRIEHEANAFAVVLMSYNYDPEEYYVQKFLEEGWW